MTPRQRSRGLRYFWTTDQVRLLLLPDHLNLAARNRAPPDVADATSSICSIVHCSKNATTVPRNSRHVNRATQDLREGNEAGALQRFPGGNIRRTTAGTGNRAQRVAKTLQLLN